MSIPREDRDYLRTTVYKTGNTGIDLTQDIVVTIAVNMLATYAATGIVYNLGGKQVLGAATKRLNVKVTQKFLERLAVAANQKLAGTMTKQLSQVFTRNAAKYALRAMGKTVVSAGTKAGVAAAGGCTLGPVGCAAGTAIGVAIFIAELSFSIANIVQDLTDKKGITQLLHSNFVDQISDQYKKTIDNGYRELMDEDDDYEYTEEEVYFGPELFLLDIDPDDGEIYMAYDNEWAQKFVQYQDEYLQSIGVEPGWELRMVTGELGKPDLSVGRLDEKKKKVVVGLTMSASFVVCLLLMLFLFLVIL